MDEAVRKNRILQLDVTDLNNLGYGVAHVGGMTVFVAGAVDGETVLARIIKVNRTYAVARLESIVVPSPFRIEPACRVRGCGGCAYQSVSYPHELELKRERVVYALRKHGLTDLTVAPVTGAKDGKGNYLVSGYRNKVQMPVGQTADGRIVIGYYSSRTHRIVEAADCVLQSPSFRPILETVRRFAEREGIPAYDEQTGNGILRHVYLREASVTGEILVTLVVNGKSIPGEDVLVRELLQTEKRIAGVLLNVNTERTNVICGPEYRLLYGKDHLTDRLGGVDLCITPQSFYQVNHSVAEAIYGKAQELLGATGEDTVLDLYCGAGSIGLSMARRIRNLIGVEIVPSAVECARKNAGNNGIGNARFICEDAENVNRYLKALLSDPDRPVDAVILDPPRKGCSRELLETLAGSQIGRIVYLSCDPDTLARDIRALSPVYLCSELFPYDMFPRTGHVETVVLITRE